MDNPCVQKTSVFAYLVMKFAGPAQDNCGRAVCLPSQKARSALVYLTSTDLDSVEEGAPAKRRRISSVGVITDEVQQRLLERLSKGYLGAYLWESGIRGQDVENCLKAERRSGVAVLAISALQNCLRVYESLKIDEVRAMRQHFPMNLRGKQIRHVLGYIPGALYGQAVLQGMSRAYHGVLEEANRRLRATTPASSAMTPLTPPSAAPPADLLAGAQSKAVPPASGGFRDSRGGYHPYAAFSLLSMSRSNGRVRDIRGHRSRSHGRYRGSQNRKTRRRLGAASPPIIAPPTGIGPKTPSGATQTGIAGRLL